MLKMSCVNLKTGTNYVPVTIDLPRNLTENTSENLFNIVSVGEAIPIVLLIIEVIFGFIFNTFAIVLYCNRRGLLQNAGNMFTVSLMAVDLLFCGFCLPLTIVIEFIKTTSFYQLNNLCMATRCFLMFSAIGSATGTALLALDRGDISLRPSRRFFSGKRPLIAIIFAWVVSSAGLIIPMVAIWLYDSFTELKYTDKPARATKLNWIPSRGSLEMLVESGARTATSSALCDTNCNSICYKDQCTLTHTELAVRLGYQITVFVAAGAITLAIYTKIILYVHKRSFREEKKRGLGILISKRNETRKQTSSMMTQLICCGFKDQRGALEMEGGKTQTNLENSAKTETTVSLGKDINTITESYGSMVQNEQRNNTSTENNRTEYGDTPVRQPVVVVESIEPSSHSARESHNDCPPLENGTLVTDSVQSKPEEHKTDFASVALSITVVLALKRMVAAKVKRKQKKLKHLRRMTILIIVTFFVSWVPFHILPMVQFLTKDTPNLFIICHASDCAGSLEILNSTKFVSVHNAKVENEKSFWNGLFLWTLVFAAASSVLNPFVYSFSREKIREDFKRTFGFKIKFRRKEKKFSAGNRMRTRGGSAIWSSQWGRKRRTETGARNERKSPCKQYRKDSRSDYKKSSVDKGEYLNHEPNACERLLTSDINEHNVVKNVNSNSYTDTVVKY
nr:uncharacterized protein LOC100184969 [Ciona intestinalis]|eukprot:XP_002127820.2 uncharacterized protein LOC100184969 [Ciona intestinalis]